MFHVVKRMEPSHQKRIGFNRQANNSARAAHFFVHCFAINAWLQRENPSRRFMEQEDVNTPPLDYEQSLLFS